jgi:hypothetical protein
VEKKRMISCFLSHDLNRKNLWCHVMISGHWCDRSFSQCCLPPVDRTKGITLVAIDRSKVLADQGPFDIILHKVNIFLWALQIHSGTDFFVCVNANYSHSHFASSWVSYCEPEEQSLYQSL